MGHGDGVPAWKCHEWESWFLKTALMVWRESTDVVLSLICSLRLHRRTGKNHGSSYDSLLTCRGIMSSRWTGPITNKILVQLKHRPGAMQQNQYHNHCTGFESYWCSCSNWSVVTVRKTTIVVDAIWTKGWFVSIAIGQKESTVRTQELVSTYSDFC